MSLGTQNSLNLKLTSVPAAWIFTKFELVLVRNIKVYFLYALFLCLKRDHFVFDYLSFFEFKIWFLQKLNFMSIICNKSHISDKVMLCKTFDMDLIMVMFLLWFFENNTKSDKLFFIINIKGKFVYTCILFSIDPHQLNLDPSIIVHYRHRSLVQQELNS
jgi:hypothetical protein